MKILQQKSSQNEPDVTGYRYDDFERSSELVALGESVTHTALPEIRKWLEIATTDRAPGKRAVSQPGIVSPALNAVAQK